MKEQLPLLILSAILLPLSCRLAVTTGSQASTESPATPPSSSQIRWTDVVRKTDLTQVLCRKLLAPNSAFECIDKSTSGYETAFRDYGILHIFLVKKSNKKENAMLLLFQASDREVRQRMMRGWTLQQTNRLKFYPEVAEVHEHIDFFYVIIAKTICFYMEFFSNKLISTHGEQPYPNRVIDGLDQAVGMLQGLHKAGNVAINFQIMMFNKVEKESVPQFTRLEWMVKAGEEVGQFPFDPVLTDPVALKDPTFKADIALDYYVLGVWLFNALRNVAEKTTKMPGDSPEVLENKKNNLFEFPWGTHTALAFLVAWWTQDNREARASVQVWKEVWAYLGSVSKLDTLETTITYSTTEDPLKFPAFQGLLDSLYLPSLRPQKDQQPNTGQSATSSETSTSHRILFWVGMVSAGLLILTIGVWLICRRSQQTEVEALETRKTLQATGTEEPTVSA